MKGLVTFSASATWSSVVRVALVVEQVDRRGDDPFALEPGDRIPDVPGAFEAAAARRVVRAGADSGGGRAGRFLHGGSGYPMGVESARADGGVGRDAALCVLGLSHGCLH